MEPGRPLVRCEHGRRRRRHPSSLGCNRAYRPVRLKTHDSRRLVCKRGTSRILELCSDTSVAERC